MRYNKGQKGPESTNDVEIFYVDQKGPQNNPITTGHAAVKTKNGLRGVSILAQGKHSQALHEALDKGMNVLRLKLRWTGREAVTVTGVES